MERNTTPLFSPAQVTLRGLGITITLLCVFLAVGIYSNIAVLRVLLVVSPFFLVLWALWLIIARPFVLGASYFVAHAIALGLIGRWILGTSDATGQWARALPLMFVDMPVGGVAPLFYLPMPIAFAYLFVVGGAVWGLFGWWSARGRTSRRLRAW
jgi:hypothetical protein